MTRNSLELVIASTSTKLKQPIVLCVSAFPPVQLHNFVQSLEPDRLCLEQGGLGGAGAGTGGLPQGIYVCMCLRVCV